MKKRLITFALVALVGSLTGVYVDPVALAPVVELLS